MHTPIYVFNSLTHEKEIFTPLHPEHIGMYVCGPTVSGESHLGHARPFITFDVIYRFFLHLGYKVRYVRNITDAGHFEEEGREAEDKISSKAFLERLEPMELVQKYTYLFHKAMDAFNCLPPSIEPTATGHIVEQIAMIRDIIQKGLAYEVNGSVYFDIKKYAELHHYGILSKRKLEELLETTRTLESQNEKRNKADFALWKKAPPQHIMNWESPWGKGFPGWHIECSAMSTKYLGKHFDIHGGGMDLQFPHHECEIAQSTVSNGQFPAKYWLHNNMITINGKKMGKSYNNVIKLSELFSGTHPLLTQAYSPITVRFFILQTHYRSTLDFGNEALQAAEKGLKRLLDAYHFLQILPTENIPESPSDTLLTNSIQEHLNQMASDIRDDFNTAKVLSHIFEIIPIINSIKDKNIDLHTLGSSMLHTLKTTFKTFIIDIFGIETEAPTNTKLNEVMNILMAIRQDARTKKDFTTSDHIRDTLLHKAGILLKDGKNGEVNWE